MIAKRRSPRAMQQSVWITFSDGTKAGFNGQAVVKPGDQRTIKDIAFTKPQPLPAGAFWLYPAKSPDGH